LGGLPLFARPTPVEDPGLRRRPAALLGLEACSRLGGGQLAVSGTTSLPPLVEELCLLGVGGLTLEPCLPLDVAPGLWLVELVEHRTGVDPALCGCRS